MGGLGVKVQHFPLTLLVVLTTLTLPCEHDHKMAMVGVDTVAYRRTGCQSVGSHLALLCINHVNPVNSHYGS